MMTKRALGWVSLLATCAATAFAALAFLIALSAGVDDSRTNDDQVGRWLTVSVLTFGAALALLVAGVIALRSTRRRRQPSDDARLSDSAAPATKPDDPQLTLPGYIAGILTGALLLVPITGSTSDAVAIAFPLALAGLAVWVVGGAFTYHQKFFVAAGY